jgi:hypothetical protein
MDLFDSAAERLEHHTDFDRLEARGTLRIALKDAGLTSKGLTLQQLRVVLEKVMPEHLEKRAVSNSVEVCDTVIGELAQAGGDESDTQTGADEIFHRLGGG